MDAPKLPSSSTMIYDRVIAAMQDAEEMGGVDGLDEYCALMRAIARECNNRIRNAAFAAAQEEGPRA